MLHSQPDTKAFWGSARTAEAPRDAEADLDSAQRALDAWQMVTPGEREAWERAARSASAGRGVCTQCQCARVRAHLWVPSPCPPALPWATHLAATLCAVGAP